MTMRKENCNFNSYFNRKTPSEMNTQGEALRENCDFHVFLLLHLQRNTIASQCIKYGDRYMMLHSNMHVIDFQSHSEGNFGLNWRCGRSFEILR